MYSAALYPTTPITSCRYALRAVGVTWAVASAHSVTRYRRRPCRRARSRTPVRAESVGSLRTTKLLHSGQPATQAESAGLDMEVGF